MIRIVLENILLFLLPSLCYVAYIMLTKPEKTAGARGAEKAVAVLDDAPLLWLFGSGAVLVIITLILFGSTSGGKPGQRYEPPVLKDGQIEPGKIN